MKEAVNSGLMYEIFGTYHAPVPEYPIPECLLTNVRDKTNTAILVLGRNAGGEECDRRLEGDYYLTEEEKKLVSQVCENFPEVIVILNVNGLIDLEWTTKYTSVKSILFLGLPGEGGAKAVAEIIKGNVSPSGKLAFTIAHRYEDYPSAKHFSWDKEKEEHILTYEDYGLVQEENGSSVSEKPGEPYIRRISITATGISFFWERGTISIRTWAFLHKICIRCGRCFKRRRRDNYNN